MLAECLSSMEDISIDILCGLYEEDALDWLDEICPGSTDILAELSALDPPKFHPIVSVWGPDGDGKDDSVLISEVIDREDFMTSLLVALSVMDVGCFAITLDSWVVTGPPAPEAADLTPEQRHALGDPHVFRTLCVRASNKDSLLAETLLPYTINDEGKAHPLEDTTVDSINAPDPLFEGVAAALKEVWLTPVEERVVKYMNDFYDNEEASAAHFENTAYVREDAKQAIKELETRGEIKYVQRILEDSLMAAGGIHPLMRSINSTALDEEISEHMTSETETAQWLIQARLML